jgi:serine protease Do
MNPLRFVYPTAIAMLIGGLGTPLWAQEARRASATEQPAAAAARETATDLSQAFRNIAGQISPSVVSIRVTRTVNAPQMQIPDEFQRFFRGFGPGDEQQDQGPNDQNDQAMPPSMGPGGSMREIGTGSGVIVESENGTAYILTNNHVAGGNSEMQVKLSDGRVIKGAKLVGADAATDLAVVKIEVSGLQPTPLGDSDQLKQGDWVLAFGAPFGFVGSMSHGIVSALHRQAGILGATGYENFIQTDAPINPGNSGGPLVDLQGKVVGINSAIATESGGFQGIGFAVPINMAKPIYRELKANGKIVRGWLGLQIASVSDVPEQANGVGYDGTSGVLVSSVMNDAPAAGKLHPGDVITGLNGKEVQDASDLRNAVALMAPGTEVTLRVMRSGKPQEVKVKLGEQPENLQVAAGRGQENSQAATLGMRLTELNDQLAQRYGLNERSGGALVTQVAPNSLAASAGVKPGDVITRVGDTDIKSAADARKALSNVDTQKGIRLYVTNRQGSEYLFLRAAR